MVLAWLEVEGRWKDRKLGAGFLYQRFGELFAEMVDCIR